MLSGDAYLAVKTRPARRFQENRRELDSLGPRPKNEQQLHSARAVVRRRGQHGPARLAILMSQPGRVDDDAAHQLLARDFSKGRMGHQKSHDVGLAYGLERL